MLALVTALEPIVAKITELTAEIRRALDAHPDGATFRSLFIAPDSFLCAATMLAEIGDCRERYPSYRALAADAGQAPVESGKSRHAKFGWACDHRLREAFNVLADSSRRHNPWAVDIYQRARARGAGHAHASRILGRAWSQIIWRLWHDHDTYNASKHTARQRLITAHTDTGGLVATVFIAGVGSSESPGLERDRLYERTMLRQPDPPDNAAVKRSADRGPVRR